MKQDLVEGGAGAATAQRNPNALYEVRLVLAVVPVLLLALLLLRCPLLSRTHTKCSMPMQTRSCMLALPHVCPQIDKLSMDHVTVFPDGQLNVEAVASVPGTAAFHRPVSAGEAAAVVGRHMNHHFVSNQAWSVLFTAGTSSPAPTLCC